MPFQMLPEIEKRTYMSPDVMVGSPSLLVHYTIYFVEHLFGDGRYAIPPSRRIYVYSLADIL